MLPPKKNMTNMTNMTKKMAQEILLAAVDAAASFYEEEKRRSLADIYARAYQEVCGLKEEDFLPTVIKESYWFRRFGRIVSPICILAVQNFLEKEEAPTSVPDGFSPCSYCPYADKRVEARGYYACRPGFIPTRRFTHLSQTSMEELDNDLNLVEGQEDVFARESRKIIEKIFHEEISPKMEDSWHRSQLISG